MKTLIISDVHANIVALEAVWKKERNADLIVFAGDVVDYGIHPRECIDWMIDKDVTAVTGNHDLGVIDAYDHPDEHAPLTWRVENARRLDQDHIDYLKQLPDRLILDLDGDTYGLTHAYRGYDVIRSAEAFLHFGNTHFSKDLRRMIFGHTHRRELLYLSDEDCWLNPGSVSYRRADEDYRGAHYAVIIDGKPSLRSVPYPVEKLHQYVVASSVCTAEKQAMSHCWGPRES